MAQLCERLTFANVAKARFRPGAICGLILLLVVAMLLEFSRVHA